MESIQFGTSRIDFSVRYTNRKTLGITVHPDMHVEVKAPTDAEMKRIKELVYKRGDWILMQQNHFLSFYPRRTPKRYVSGESHYYLGRQYQLKVELSDLNKAKYKGRYIYVYTDDKTKAESILKGWYRNRAKIKFKEIAKPLIERFKKYDVEPNNIYIKSMQYRWGSCSPKGNILLNPELIQAPKACVEYVIIHELCHLVHPNHSKEFFRLQKKEMPDWEKWKRKLEDMMA